MRFGARVPRFTDASGASISKETSASGAVFDAKVPSEKMSKSGPITGLPTTLAVSPVVVASLSVGL